MKPLGFIKDWKGLMILVATVQLMFISMCLGRENYLNASLTYSKGIPVTVGGVTVVQYSITVTCLLKKTQHPQQSTDVTLYIYRRHGEFLNSDSNSETDGDLILRHAYTLSNNVGIESNNTWKKDAENIIFIFDFPNSYLSINNAKCTDYDKTYRCMYTHEIDNCEITSEVNTSADVKLPEKGCLGGDTTKTTSVSLNGCPSKNDDNTPNNNLVIIIVAIVLSVLAVVATVAGICYCKKKKAKKANKEIVPAKEDKKEENVSETVEPATMDVSSGKTMDDVVSMNADDAASGMSKATDALSQRSDDSGSSGSSDTSSVKTVDAV